MTLAEQIGLAAREARARTGLTQAEVAEKIKIATESYARLERGHMLPAVPTLLRLSTELGVSADRLLGLAPGTTRTVKATEPSPEVSRLVHRVGKLDKRAMRFIERLIAEFSLRELPTKHRRVSAR